MSVSELARRGREREVRRQLLVLRLERALPPVLSELAKMLAASLIGYWVIGKLLALAHGPRPEYTYAAFGLLYSFQATYYKVKLARDPTFKIPKCACAGRAHDDSEKVLRSRFSSVLGVPNSVFAVAGYAAVFGLVWTGHTDAALAVTAAAVVASGYLAFVMVARVKGLCATCVNMAALNVLLLVQLLT